MLKGIYRSEGWVWAGLSPLALFHFLMALRALPKFTFSIWYKSVGGGGGRGEKKKSLFRRINHSILVTAVLSPFLVWQRPTHREHNVFHFWGEFAFPRSTGKYPLSIIFKAGLVNCNLFFFLYFFLFPIPSLSLFVFLSCPFAMK